MTLIKTVNCVILCILMINCGPLENAPRPKRVFVTQNKSKGGNLTEYGRAGDYFCEKSAGSVELGGIWKPWISSYSVVSINAIDEIKDVGPWHDIEGNLIFEDKTDFARGPRFPLTINEIGRDIGIGEFVWTGTLSNGIRSDNNCFDKAEFRIWYSLNPEVTGDVGIIGSQGPEWTYAVSLPCNEYAHLICIEQ